MANVKATDLIDFTRASKGHALAKVSYGDNELPSASFEVIGAGTWDGLEFIDTVGSQVRPGVTSQTSLTDGTTYALFINITEITGATQVRIDGLDGTDRLLGEGDHRISFISNGGTPRVRLEDTSTSVNDGFTLQNALTAKEVTFNQPDGTLQLFEHPNNIPRIEYDADGNLLGLLIEEARTNLFIESEDFSSSKWVSANNTETANAVGPNKVTNSAYTLSDDNSGGTGVVYVNETVTGLTTGNDYTASVFAKAGSANWLGIKAQSLGVTGNQAYFDLSNGVLGNVNVGLTATMEDYGDGWYRCSITFEATSDISGAIRIQLASDDQNLTVDLDGTNNILIFGAQFEEGSFPTSYIKTTGSTASRSADVASIDVDQFGYNHDESTFIAEASELGGLNSNLQRHTLFSTETASALRLYVGKSGGGGGSGDEIYVGEGASNTYFELGDITQNTFYKVGVVVKTNDISASLNGGAIVSDSSVALAKDETTIGIGSRTYSGTNIFNGHIKSLTYTPKRLSNAKLQELTS